VAPQVALFIFHGASRDSQAGVVPKLSPAVAFLTKLLRRKLGQGKGKHPAAVAPADGDDGNFTSLAAPAFSGEVTEAAHVGSDSDDDAGGGFAEPTAGNPLRRPRPRGHRWSPGSPMDGHDLE
jgi:hypothetical protein